LIPSLRRKFNEEFSEEKYQRFLSLLEERTGLSPQFRVSETPFFIPRQLIDRMALCGREIVEELLVNAEYMHASSRAIPPEFHVPNEPPAPRFIQADFGIDQNGDPKLVEIQGFPSVYAYQPVLADCYRDAYAIDLPFLLDDLTPAAYHKLLRQAIVGDRDPRNVVLMEIDPLHQKTLADFTMTERICGIRTADISLIEKRGRKLYYEDIPIDRIYNRAIVDELQRRRIPLQFDFRDDLDVEWAGHPNWFFRLSKFSLPYMNHPAVPRTRFLDDVPTIDEPSAVVLKPLFSFAGLGVIVGPTHEQIEAARGKDYVVQERVDFASVLETPYGPTKVEIRIMYLWPDKPGLDELRAVNTIVRTGRGSQMGVDHNKGLKWVGASAAFHL